MIPVAIPANIPIRKAIGSAKMYMGINNSKILIPLTPPVIKAAVTAPPNGKLPSAVRSGKSKME